MRGALAAVCAAALLAGCAVDSQHRELAPLSQADAAWLARITYGLDSATVARFQRLGRQRFLEEQLSGRRQELPKAVQAQIDAQQITGRAAVTLVVEEIAEQKRIRTIANEDLRKEAHKRRVDLSNRMIYEARRRELLRALYSPAQLKEQMVWFWLNHFSLYGSKGYLELLVADYSEHAIRPHALGSFRDLVLATLRHPAMVQYLNNEQNARGHINENYARELMELHTLGVDAGYTQADVQMLARILTGAGFDASPEGPRKVAESQRRYIEREGLFTFNPARHDFSRHVLLGEAVQGEGFREIENAVNLLVAQPACARFISTKLATYLVADNPPASLVDAMALTFQRTHGDIAATLRTLLTAPEFEASLGGKLKDPMHYVVSGMRLALDGRVVTNLRPAVNWLNSQGEGLYDRSTPDGYALTQGAWASSGQLSRRFEVARDIGGDHAALFRPEDGRPGGASKGPPKPAPAAVARLDTPLYQKAIAPYLSQGTQRALAQAASPQEWNTLLLASPELNYR